MPLLVVMFKEVNISSNIRYVQRLIATQYAGNEYHKIKYNEMYIVLYIMCFCIVQSK